MEYRDQVQKGVGNRKGKVQQIAMIDPEQIQQKKSQGVLSGNDNLMDQMLNMLDDEPDDAQREQDKYRHFAEAKQQKQRAARAPKIQQPFKGVLDQVDSEGMEIEYSGKKKSSQANKFDGIDLGELDEMLDAQATNNQGSASKNKTGRKTNAKNDTLPATAQIGLKSDLPTSISTLDKKDCLFKLHGFGQHFRENKRFIMLDFNPKPIQVQDVDGD